MYKNREGIKSLLIFLKKEEDKRWKKYDAQIRKTHPAKTEQNIENESPDI